MTFVQEKHEHALASRLKSLSELLMRDVKKFYDFKKLEFEPRWFSTIYLLKEKGALSVTEIAKELLQSHPAINQTVNILEKKGLIESRKDGNDERKRLIFLTAKGKERIKTLTPFWTDIFNVNTELLKESAPLFLEQLSKFEKALTEKSLFDRIIEKDNRRNSGIYLKSFSNELKDFF